MNHLTEEQLVLHYYEEAPGAGEHLALCAACRGEFGNLRRVLDTLRESTPPEPLPSFEALTWQKISPELRQRRRGWWVLVPAMAMLLVAAFAIGRYSVPRPSLAQGMSAAGRERILLVAVGDHLQRSQMVLVELANARPDDTPGISGIQERARNLVGENRLYRQSTAFSGDREFEGVLDDLERVLLDVANSRAHLSAPELHQIQQRIESRGLIFKIRVIDSNLQKEATEKL